MTVEEIFAHFQTIGSETIRAHNRKYGATDNQFGVKMGDIRALAKKIKTNHALALRLWETGNIEARFLAILILDAKKLSGQELSEMVKSERFTHVADWLYNYVIKTHPEAESLRLEWLAAADAMHARVGWSLTAGCVARNPNVLDIPALLDRIENEMLEAPPEAQWTMNTTLAQIGICMPQYRERALQIGEKLGVYRNYPVSKGCTSPFAPVWIQEMVKRQGEKG